MPVRVLEDAVAEYNTSNPKTQLTKKVSVTALSFKILQSNEGESIDSDSWQTETVTFKVLPEKKLANSFLTVRKSKQSDRGYEVLIMRHQWIDPEHGFCLSQLDMTSESEGVEIVRSRAKRITASQAANLLNDKSKLVWLRFRDGNVLKLPAISSFKMEH